MIHLMMTAVQVGVSDVDAATGNRSILAIDPNGITVEIPLPPDGQQFVAAALSGLAIATPHDVAQVNAPPLPGNAPMR